MKKVTLVITIAAVLIAGFIFTNNNATKTQKVQTINFETPLEIVVPSNEITMKGVEITVPVRTIAMNTLEIAVPVQKITMKKALVINVKTFEVAKKSVKKVSSKI